MYNPRQFPCYKNQPSSVLAPSQFWLPSLHQILARSFNGIEDKITTANWRNNQSIHTIFIPSHLLRNLSKTDALLFHLSSLPPPPYPLASMIYPSLYSIFLSGRKIYSLSLEEKPSSTYVFSPYPNPIPPSSPPEDCTIANLSGHYIILYVKMLRLLFIPLWTIMFTIFFINDNSSISSKKNFI